EAATEYRRFLHGEAVAWGMLGATRLAVWQRMLPPAEAARLTELVLAYGPVPSLGNLRPSDMERHLGGDKKDRDGQIYFVLPRRVGEVAITGGVTVSQAIEVLETLQQANPFIAPKTTARESKAKGARRKVIHQARRAGAAKS